jgi:hypothetical protein
MNKVAFKETDIFWQPEITEDGDGVIGHEDEEYLFSFEVWSTLRNLLKDYPNCEPVEHERSEFDIEYPNFVDEVAFNSPPDRSTEDELIILELLWKCEMES